jgi:hypothetical protein
MWSRPQHADMRACVRLVSVLNDEWSTFAEEHSLRDVGGGVVPQDQCAKNRSIVRRRHAAALVGDQWSAVDRDVQIFT